MKKHLIAAAVAAAVVAPAAMAQNVTLYGGLDAGVQIYDGKGKSSVTSATQSRIYTSRVGMRGTEDLGGGLRAGFRLEGVLNATDGTMGSGGSFFSRESNVFISGGFGEIAVGRFDLSAAEGVDTFTSRIGNLGFVGSFELSTDRPNSFRYTSPRMNGVTAQLGFDPNVAANGTTKAATGERTSGSVSYVAGPLGLIAGYETQDGASGDTKIMHLGARYDFGIAHVGLYYGDRDNPNTNQDVKVTILSASAPLGTGYALVGSYRNAKVDNTANKTRDFNIGVSKALSKRTTLYAIYADTDVKGSGAAFLSQAATEDAKRYMFNVVHTF
jgi:predicted porin